MNTGASTLFDLPGPAGRRRIRIATVVSLLLIVVAVVAVVRRLTTHGMLAADEWRVFTQWPTIRFLLGGVWATVLVTVVAMAIALPAGALVALVRLSRARVARALGRAYVEVFRAIPLLLLLYMFLFGLPRLGLTFPVFWQLTLAIVLNNAAVFAEILRAGILAVERGQSEAASSLGMTYWQAMWLVVIPQAVRKVVPALVGQSVRLLKDSSLGYVVSYLELLHQSQVLGEYYHTVLPTYLVAAVVYIAINITLSRFAHLLENRGLRGVRRRRHPESTALAENAAIGSGGRAPLIDDSTV
ncbi:amino acid ABC transporter permease [Actinoallomurus spadix]|uniref:Amino acid ABC transporter permease n=1 Tax=Actinoallomurus spadix TaxID=79912 RepID=A0ABN0XPB0_9ACTN|nr:amino acid ABC transporter permease [Actinoallomurus spadix]MCO5988455.1 amino acid ABC transporter permease [Actinoallomurus spadix]